jgi:hypothetical protein
VNRARGEGIAILGAQREATHRCHDRPVLATEIADREGGVDMTLGPLEYTVIGFEGNRFNGEIARELESVVDKGVIRLVDVVFITKNIDGEVAVLEVDNKDDPRFASFAPLLAGLQGLFTEDDVVAIGADLPVNTSALAVLFEHRWAEDLKDAINAAGGFLVSRTTIAPEILEVVNAEMEAVPA